tara:strand:- start:4657 stop:5229 length:573 start_codon:yes stop_codon:yes gene_type:complete
MTYNDNSIDEYFKESIKIAEYQYSLKEKIISITDIIQNKIQNDGKILICGNGGSAADSQHIAAELVVKFKKERKPISAIALTTDTSVLTSIGNDFGFEYIFSRQIEALGNKNDFLIAISTSGKSKNIIEALKKSSEMGIESLVLVGQNFSTVEKYSNNIISIPTEITGVVQQAHITIGQLICKILEDKIT